MPLPTSRTRVYMRKRRILADQHISIAQSAPPQATASIRPASHIASRILAAAQLKSSASAVVYPFDPWLVPRDPVTGIPFVSSRALLQFAGDVPFYTARLYHAAVYVRSRLPVGMRRINSSTLHFDQFQRDVHSLSGVVQPSTAADDGDEVRWRRMWYLLSSCQCQRAISTQDSASNGQKSTQAGSTSKCGVILRLVQNRAAAACSAAASSGWTFGLFVWSALVGPSKFTKSKPVSVHHPLRLLIGLSLSATILVFAAVLAAFAVRTLLFKVDQLHDAAIVVLDSRQLSALQGSDVQSSLTDAVRSGNISELKLLPQAISRDVQRYQSMASRDTLYKLAVRESVLQFFPILASKEALKIVRDVVKLVINISGWTSGVLSFLGVLVLLRAMSRQYKVHIAEMRKGNYTLMPKQRMAAVPAMKWVPLQLWHTLFGFASMFVVVFFVTASIAALLVRGAWLSNYLNIQNVLIGFITFSLGSIIATRLVLARTVKDKATIRSRVAFNACDIWSLVWQLGAGLMPVITRLLVSISTTFLLFTRTDLSEVAQPLSFLDSAFKAYAGMQIVDHTHNNPILLVLCELLWMDVQWARATHNYKAQAQQAADYAPSPNRAPVAAMPSVTGGRAAVPGPRVRAAACVAQKEQAMKQQRKANLRRAKAKVWLAITLHNNPQLIALRLHGRQLQGCGPEGQLTKSKAKSLGESRFKHLKEASSTLITSALLRSSERS